jgi:hypothetical protein
MSAPKWRRRPAAHHELVLLLDLELLPLGAALAGAVGAGGAFHDQAFPAVAIGAGIERAAITHGLFRQPQQGRPPPGHARLEGGPARRQRLRAQVGVAVAQQVEGHERRWLLVSRLRRR